MFVYNFNPLTPYLVSMLSKAKQKILCIMPSILVLNGNKIILVLLYNKSGEIFSLRKFTFSQEYTGLHSPKICF